MVLKRVLLPILCVIGGIVPAAVLYFSACALPAVTEVPPSIQEMPPETEGDAKIEGELSLPFLIPGTTLIAEYLTVYDGPYLEDGSNREVANIPVLQVCNAGTATILSAGIQLLLGDVCLEFHGEWILPGTSVALLECSGNNKTQKQITDCNGWQEAVTTESLPEGLFVCEYGAGMLALTNHTEKAMRNIKIIYKGWLSPPGIYVGGIAYAFTVAELQPEETIYIDPERYVCGYSKIVYIMSEP